VAVRYRRRSERGIVAALGRLLHELRYPTTRRGRIIVATLAALVFGLLSLLVIGGFLLARTLTPPHAGETLDPTRFIVSTQAVTFLSDDGTTHNAWFFPGIRNGPVIVLLHGYRSSRAEVLTLASALQEHRYNVLAFNLAGHGESPRSRTTLGYQETQELLAALQMLRQRTDLDTERIGLWGQSLGAYAALNAAAHFPGVKALVVDSVYSHPTDLLRLELARAGTSWVPLLNEVARLEYRIVTFLHRRASVPLNLDALGGMPKLFVSAADQSELAAMTRQLFEQSPGPKEHVVLPQTSLTILSEQSRMAYVNQVVTFFLTHMAPVAR